MSFFSETCSDSSDCSDDFSVRCAKMGRDWVERGNEPFVVSCVQGVCSCNIQFKKSRNLHRPEPAPTNVYNKDVKEKDEL